MSDTDSGWDETSVAPPPPVTDGRPTTTTKRAKRDSLRNSLRTQAKRLVPLLGTLIAVLVTSWTMRLQVQVEAVQDRADGAQAKGEKSERVAVEAKVENEAGYAATAEKVDATGELISKLTVEVNALRAEVEAMKAAKAGRRVRRKAPIKVPPVVPAPLPDTPKAAAAEMKE